MANHLSKNAQKGLGRLGDLILPASGEFPKYSDVAGFQYLDEMVENAPEDDISSLSLVLSILAFMPGFILQWIVSKMEKSQYDPSNGILAVTFRQLNVGIRGLLYSTYYSEKINPNYKGKTPEQLIDFEVKRVAD
ncbi:MAG: hypothetical protein K1X55_06420 [Chitinophagales bacterium]|nr:hypothetical protein [Chitinophagales bacterium]